MARLNDALGIFNDTAWVNPDAAPTDNGLDPTTGWARGVIEDPNSASGYSYNGIPVNTDGSRFESQHTPISGYVPPSPEPIWNEAGYYDDQMGHYSNNGGASWDFDPNTIQSADMGVVPGSGANPGQYKPSSYMDGGISLPEENFGLQQVPTDTQGNVQIGDAYINNVGQVWDPAVQGWADTTQPTAVGNLYGQATDINSANKMAGSFIDKVSRVTPQDFINIDRALDPTSNTWQNPNDPYKQWRDSAGNVNGVMDVYDPRVNPETAKEATFGSASSGFNPVSAIATEGLDKFLPGRVARPLGEAVGAVADAGTFGAISGISGGNLDMTDPKFWGEAGMAAANAGSLGLGSGIAKGAGAGILNRAATGAAKNLAANAAGNVAYNELPGAMETYSKTGLPGSGIAGNETVQKGAAFGGAFAAGAGAFALTPTVSTVGKVFTNVGQGAAKGKEILEQLVSVNSGNPVYSQVAMNTGPNGPYRPFQAKGMETAEIVGPAVEKVKAYLDTGEFNDILPGKDLTNYLTTDGDLITLSHYAQKYRDKLYNYGLDEGIDFVNPTPAEYAKLRDIDSKIKRLDELSEALAETIQYKTDIAVNGRTFVHSTENFDYKVPDPARGIRNTTQGPGTYLTANPNGTGNSKYGDRAFTVEFDGKALNLHDEADVTYWMPLRDGIRDDLMQIPGIDQIEVDQLLDDAFRPDALKARRWSRGKTETNNFAYRDALSDAVNDVVASARHKGIQDSDLYRKSLGVFEQIADQNNPNEAFGPAIVQSAIGKSGYDATFLHSSVDGDVLVVINGEKARVTGELHKGHKFIKDGSTVEDVVRDIDASIGPSRQTLDFVPSTADTSIIYVRSAAGEQKGFISKLVDGTYSIVDNKKPNLVDYADTIGEAKIKAERLFGAGEPKGQLHSLVNDGSKSPSPGGTGAFLANTAAGAGIGAVTSELSGEDWKEGALIGGLTGASRFGEAKVKAKTGLNPRGRVHVTPEEEEPRNAAYNAAKAIQDSLFGKVPETPRTDDPMKVALDALNAERVRMGGKPFDTLDEWRESMDKAMPDLPPIYPRKGQPNPTRPMDLRNDDYDPAFTPPAGRPNAPSLELRMQKAAEPTFEEKFKKNVLGILGIPLEVFVGGDISAGGRQARGLAHSHPVLWAEAVVKGIQSMDPKVADKLITEMKMHPRYKDLVEVGNLHLAFKEGEEQLGQGLAGAAMAKASTAIKSKVGGKLGSFLAAPADYLPATERNYNMTLDWIRFTVANQIIDNAVRNGREIDKALLTNVTNYINHKTGYGTGFLLDASHGALSVPFLAPRYWLSKYQSVGDTFAKFAKEPALRGEIAKNTAGWLGTMAAISAASAYAGGQAGIFQNPLAGSFGGVGSQDRSFDATGGLATEIRNVGRIATGSRVDATGKTIPEDRDQLVGRFLRSKLSPNAGTLTSLLLGEDYNGNPANLKSLEGLSNLAKGSVIPLFYQEVYKAFQKEFPGAAVDENAFGALLDKIKNDPASIARFAGTSAAAAFGVSPHIELDNKYDERERRLREMFPDQPGITWNTTNSVQRNEYNAKYGKMTADHPDAIRAQEIRDTQRANNVKAQANIDTTFEPGREWREAYQDLLISISSEIQANELNAPFTGKPYDSDMDRAVREWAGKIKELTPFPGGTDWRAVEAWVASDPTRAKLIDQYMNDPNKPDTALSDKVREYKADSKLIRESGYWELKDDVWAEFTKAAGPQPGWQPGMTYDEYRNSTIDQIKQALVSSGMNAAVAEDKAADLAAKNFPGIKFMDDVYTKQVLIPWIVQNPDAFYAVAKWGYISRPNKVEAQILQALEPSKRK